MKKLLTMTGSSLFGASLIATPAMAHHPLNGMPMETFAHGLLSGVGHPLLGFDHLFFVIAMGIAAIFTARRYFAPAAYIAAMLAGCALMYAGVALPMTETVIVVSLLAIGGIVLSGRALNASLAIALFALFGAFHGSAFGGSIAGQEGGVGGAVLLGYALGLAVLQYGIALAAGWVAEKVLGATEASAINARLVGAMVAGVGVFLALEIVEGPIVAALTAV
ncbi:MAG: HupE/UreJ family protein [Pseudomonadota bacterium]